VTQVTVLGGGQLGWMLGLAGIPLGLEFTFLDPSPDAPARHVGQLVVGGLDDLAAAAKAAAGATVVTYEWEGVPAPTAHALARDLLVLPGARALEVSQDRVVEKETFRSLGIPTAPFRAVDDRASLDAAVGEIGLPAVLKTRRGGYDGKGQAVLRTAADVDQAWSELGGVPLILEWFVPFDRELSILAVRSRSPHDIMCWTVVENTHVGGILRTTQAPAPGNTAALQRAAEACIVPLLDSVDYVGVACVELFQFGDGLLVNEWAPRVHNSGHWTIEGAATSQFENHLRAVLGWPLGSTETRRLSTMVNCIGGMPETPDLLMTPGAHPHNYGKDPKPGRKVGHVTVVATSQDELHARVTRLQPLIDASTVG